MKTPEQLAESLLSEGGSDRAEAHIPSASSTVSLYFDTSLYKGTKLRVSFSTGLGSSSEFKLLPGKMSEKALDAFDSKLSEAAEDLAKAIDHDIKYRVSQLTELAKHFAAQFPED